jgi:hypothetical protein
MKSEENVPVMTPMSSVNAMSLTSPEVVTIRSVMAVSSVVPPVMMVRESVRLSERLMMSRRRAGRVELQLLADAVEHHDGVVDRVTRDQQDRRDHRGVELPIEEHEQRRSVISRSCTVADDRAHAVADLEAEGHVEQNQDERSQDGFGKAFH